MAKYAADTTVSPEKSLAEIRGVLARYGAGDFTFGERDTRIHLGFKLKGRLIRMDVPLPALSEFRYTKGDGRGYYQRIRSSEAARGAHAAEVRRRWRVLLLLLKAKLEATTDDSGVTDVEREFLAWTVLPDGATVAEQVLPRIERALAAGEMPPDLLALPAGRG